MKNNLAELTDIDIDVNVLRAEWAKQVTFASNKIWKHRDVVDLTFFTEYYQQLLLSIEDIIGEKPKDYVIQLHDPNLHTNKWYLTDTHKDADRNTCINLPVYYNNMEPINFYDTDIGDSLSGPKRHKSRAAKIIQFLVKPNQIGQYSEHHPTLVNVNNYHNVSVLNTSDPRIFIQMSYDITFDELLSKDINLRVI